MAGKNGGPVAGLFAGPKKEGKFSGELAKGTITDKDLIGPLAGKTIGDLVKLIKDGGAYVMSIRTSIRMERFAVRSSSIRMIMQRSRDNAGSAFFFIDHEPELNPRVTNRRIGSRPGLIRFFRVKDIRPLPRIYTDVIFDKGG